MHATAAATGTRRTSLHRSPDRAQVGAANGEEEEDRRRRDADQGRDRNRAALSASADVGQGSSAAREEPTTVSGTTVTSEACVGAGKRASGHGLGAP